MQNDNVVLLKALSTLIGMQGIQFKNVITAANTVFSLLRKRICTIGQRTKQKLLCAIFVKPMKFHICAYLNVYWKDRYYYHL